VAGGIELRISSSSEDHRLGRRDRNIRADMTLMRTETRSDKGAKMPNQAHTKAAEHHEAAAKSHRAAAEHHDKGDHAKGNDYSMEAEKHSKSAAGHSEQARTKSASKK
jgi:hypothetical protein